MVIKPEEPQADPHQSDDRQRSGGRIGGSAHDAGEHVGIDEKRSSSNANDSRGKAVLAVNKVHRIHDSDDQKNSEHQ